MQRADKPVTGLHYLDSIDVETILKDNFFGNQRKAIKEGDVVIACVHHEVHFSTLVLRMRRKDPCTSHEVFLIDSLPTSAYDSGSKDNIRGACAGHSSSGKAIAVAQKILGVNGLRAQQVRAPSQRNGYDCGMYHLLFAHTLASAIKSGIESGNCTISQWDLCQFMNSKSLATAFTPEDAITLRRSLHREASEWTTWHKGNRLYYFDGEAWHLGYFAHYDKDQRIMVQTMDGGVGGDRSFERHCVIRSEWTLAPRGSRQSQ